MAKYVKTEEGYKSLTSLNDTKMDKENPTGIGSFSLNRKTDSEIGSSSFSEGLNTTASAYCSHAEGNNTTASGDASHAEGFDTTASEKYSHAEGFKTEASGKYSHAEGNCTTASGENSHAEGGYTIAQNIYSHAEGHVATASGWTSHAEGDCTTADGTKSHAEGDHTIASGWASHAEGYVTTANGDYSHVQGKYNIADNNDTYAHIVGNGETDATRSNAHTLDWDGNAWFAGDVYVGSTSGTNKDDGSKKLATEEYINNITPTFTVVGTTLVVGNANSIPAAKGYSF